MICPSCDSVMCETPCELPWYLAALRPLVFKTRCDTCLITCYRLRLLGLVIYREGPPSMPPMYP